MKSNVPTIHVHTASDKSTVGYATFMWETMRSLANHPDELRLTVHCIGPTAAERLKDLPNSECVIVPIENGKESGSSAHGACIEHALSYTDDGNIHILSDSDTVVLASGWDDYIRTKLLDEGIGIIGTAAEEIGGFSSGNGLVQMAKHLPNTTWSALSPKYSWKSLRAMPRKDENISIDSDEKVKVYNLPLGYQVLRDVGWQIPQYLYDNNIPYQAWHQHKPSKTAKVLQGLSDYHEEYRTEDDTPFLAHQRGSLRHVYREDPMSVAFFDAVDEHLAFERIQSKPHFTREHVLVQKAFSRVRVDGEKAWPQWATNGQVETMVNVQFDDTIHHLMVDGTAEATRIGLPSSAGRKPQLLTVRNSSSGPVTLFVPRWQNEALVVPGDCAFILVCEDGVIPIR